MDIEKRNKLISLVLFFVIIALGYWLYDSITSPYAKEQARKEMTQRVRNRLESVKNALIYYQNKNENKFPKEIDSLVSFLKGDSMSVALGDSLYGVSFIGTDFNFDSLVYSPRTSKKFEYALNDTIRPNIYLLKDPDTDDRIGSLERTTSLNAPSW